MHGHEGFGVEHIMIPRAELRKKARGQKAFKAAGYQRLPP